MMQKPSISSMLMRWVENESRIEAGASIDDNDYAVLDLDQLVLAAHLREAVGEALGLSQSQVDMLAKATL